MENDFTNDDNFTLQAYAVEGGTRMDVVFRRPNNRSKNYRLEKQNFGFRIFKEVGDSWPNQDVEIVAETPLMAEAIHEVMLDALEEKQEYIFLKLTGMEVTCGACPTVVEGKTVDGQSWYMRLRHGWMRVAIENFEDYADKIIFSSYPEGYDGVISIDEMISYLEANSNIRFV